MFERIRQFFGLGQVEIPPALPPVDLDLPRSSFVFSPGVLSEREFEELKHRVDWAVADINCKAAPPLPNTSHKPPRKRAGKAGEPADPFVELGDELRRRLGAEPGTRPLASAPRLKSACGKISNKRSR